MPRVEVLDCLFVSWNRFEFYQSLFYVIFLQFDVSMLVRKHHSFLLFCTWIGVFLRCCLNREECKLCELWPLAHITCTFMKVFQRSWILPGAGLISHWRKCLFNHPFPNTKPYPLSFAPFSKTSSTTTTFALSQPHKSRLHYCQN